MGSRANIVVVQDGKYDLFYCHWCAASLPSVLFWGPAHAMAFARSQEQVDETGWLNDTWAEGGAIIDLDQHTLISYGGLDLSWHIPLRRLYLQLLEDVWAGWEVRWANRGILEMADYVGLPRDHVIMGESLDDLVQDFVACVGIHPVQSDSIASIQLEDDTLRLFPVRGGVEFKLAAGPALIDSMRDHPGYEQLPLAEWGTLFPHAGFHVDVRERCVEYWTASHASDPETYIAPLWLGWRVTWLQDNYEAHLERLGDRVSLPTWTTEELLSELESILVDPAGLQPSAARQGAILAGVHRTLLKHAVKADQTSAVLESAEAVLKEMEKGESEPLELAVEARQERFDRTVTAWKQKIQQ